MDVFLVRNGIIENVVSVNSVQQAQALYPEHTIVERTDDNQHLNPGDSL